MMDPATILAVSMPVMPEALLALGAMALLMLGVFVKDSDGEFPGWLAVALLLAAALLVFLLGGEEQMAFNGAFVSDGFSRFMKIMTLIGSAAALMMSFSYMRDAKLLKFEFPVLVILATLGMLMMISANDLIALYLGLELQSLSLYVIAAFNGAIRSAPVRPGSNILFWAHCHPACCSMGVR